MIDAIRTSGAICAPTIFAIVAGMQKISFRAVCDLIGSQKKVAQIVGVTPAMVSQVATGRRPVPAAWCPKIERATGRRVKCEQLLPEVDWAFVRKGD